eukprot:3183231-Pleurochrysis_carterae.AAC.3
MFPGLLDVQWALEIYYWYTAEQWSVEIRLKDNKLEYYTCHATDCYRDHDCFRAHAKAQLSAAVPFLLTTIYCPYCKWTSLKYREH